MWSHSLQLLTQVLRISRLASSSHIKGGLPLCCTYLFQSASITHIPAYLLWSVGQKICYHLSRESCEGKKVTTKSITSVRMTWIMSSHESSLANCSQPKSIRPIWKVSGNYLIRHKMRYLDTEH